MRLIAAGLFLTLAVLLNSIELSSQSGLPPGFPENPPPVPFRKQGTGYRQGKNDRFPLPRPYYYTSGHYFAPIRSHAHPNAHAIIDEDRVFLGMAEGNHYYPIVVNGYTVAIDLQNRKYIMFSEPEVAELVREISPERAGSSEASSSSTKRQRNN